MREGRAGVWVGVCSGSVMLKRVRGKDAVVGRMKENCQLEVFDWPPGGIVVVSPPLPGGQSKTSSRQFSLGFQNRSLSIMPMTLKKNFIQFLRGLIPRSYAASFELSLCCSGVFSQEEEDGTVFFREIRRNQQPASYTYSHV